MSGSYNMLQQKKNSSKKADSEGVFAAFKSFLRSFRCFSIITLHDALHSSHTTDTGEGGESAEVKCEKFPQIKFACNVVQSRIRVEVE